MNKKTLHINHYLEINFNENPRRFFISRLFRDRGGPVKSFGGRNRAVLVVVVLVVNENEKTITFSYESFSLHVNHY